MFPATPPVTDFSRTWLRELASWIRDDLDPIVAREGPGVLRPDDVLQLHEVFQALRVSHSITALDIRATYIHRAIMEVAGTATRWPGRLADDCDRVMAVWVSKFGRLEDLQPFLFGRGGRLEGIASPDEFSKTSLLKRWQSNCPEKLATKRAHRHGHLGFSPGSWWLNPMFACHAGIIDLEGAENGICHDTNGAYAVLLRESSEVESTSGDQFTYRCAQQDKGRFRLTSATWRTRFPIRILRSHHVNSIWGPKAGVRYEGLYRIVGWVIRTALEQDSTSDGHSTGELIFDVKFERLDPVPMSEIMKHPTAAELDDYTEYKRLRRIHREGKKVSVSQIKLVPAIEPIIDTGKTSRVLPDGQQAAQRNATFKDPVSTIFVSPAHSWTSSKKPSSPKLNVEVVDKIDSQDYGNAIKVELHDQPICLQPQIGSNDLRLTLAGSKFSRAGDIKEVAPWIDQEPALKPRVEIKLPRSSLKRPSRSPAQVISQPRTMSRAHSPFDLGPDSPASEEIELRGRRSQDHKTSRYDNMHAKHPFNKKHSKDPIFLGRNSQAKPYDGGADTLVNQLDDYFSYEPISHRASFSVGSPTPMPQTKNRKRASSSSQTTRPVSPRPLSPTRTVLPSQSETKRSLWGFNSFSSTGSFHNSDDTPPPNTSISYSDAPSQHVKPASRHSRPSLPISLKSFLSTSPIVTPVNVSSPVSVSVSGVISPLGEGVDEGHDHIRSRLVGLLGDTDHESEGKVDKDSIVFKNPFKEA